MTKGSRSTSSSFTRRNSGRIGILLGLLTAIAAWFHGHHEGFGSADELVREWEEAARTATEKTTLDQATFSQEIQQWQQKYAVAHSRSIELQKLLDEALAQSTDDAAELALYRHIADKNTPAGLSVESVEFSPNAPGYAQITLIHVKGRDRVTGLLGAALIAVDEQGQEKRRVIMDAESGQLGEEGEASNVVGIAPFDMRFFQTVLVNVDKATTFDPEWLEIALQPESRRVKSVKQRVRWDDIQMPAVK